MRGENLRRLADIAGTENISDNIISPGNAEEVAAVLALANAEKLRVCAIGNGSQQEYGASTPEPDLYIRLRRMNRLKQYEPGDLTASVEAGITVGELSAALAPHRQWLPLGAPRPDRATIGGAIATNTAGPFRFFYGAARDVVIGMRFATVEGKLVKSGGMVVKNVAGYDMAKLMIGSLGTLAIITDVNLKVFPRPATETMLLGFGSLDAAFAARDALLKSVLSPLAVDLLDLPGTEPVQLAVCYGGVGRVIERTRHELESIGRATAAIEITTRSGDEEQRFWAGVCDFSSTVRLKLSSAIQAMLPLLAGLPRPAAIRCAFVARAGSGISYIYAEGDHASLTAFCSQVRQLAVSHDAHAVIESAPREVKTQVDVWGPRRDDFAMMHKLKHAFDPNGILNPGRFVC